MGSTGLVGVGVGTLKPSQVQHLKPRPGVCKIQMLHVRVTRSSGHILQVVKPLARQTQSCVLIKIRAGPLQSQGGSHCCKDSSEARGGGEGAHRQWREEVFQQCLPSSLPKLFTLPEKATYFPASPLIYQIPQN